MSTLKLTQIGNSVGVILPKEILARLKLEKGDSVFVTDAANGVMLFKERKANLPLHRQQIGFDLFTKLTFGFTVENYLHWIYQREKDWVIGD